MKKFLLSLGFASIPFSFVTFTKELPKGPADESAYWILKHLGETLEPFPMVDKSTVNFGRVEVGKEKTASVRILNNGYGTLKVLELSLEKGTDFAIKKTSCTKPLEKGESCEIWITFKPTEPGEKVDYLYIKTNYKPQPVLLVKLFGQGQGAYVEVQPPPPVVPIPKEEKETPKEVKKTAEKPKKETKIVPKFRVWTVKPCDTLWDISTAAYGTPLLWAAIYEANKNQIMDPWMLKVGQKLKIPVLTKKEVEKYKKETIQLMEEMADRPLGPKCP